MKLVIGSRIKDLIKLYSIPPTQRRVVKFQGASFFADRRNKIEERLIAGDYDINAMKLLEMIVQVGHVCMDIGANIGVYSVIMARRVGSTGAIHSFEPVNHIRHRAILNVHLNGCRNVIMNRFALGSEPGTMEMIQVKEDEYRGGTSSFLETEAIATMGRDRFDEVQVEVQTLDEYVESKSIERLDFIKMDIEGSELAVLKGGQKTLAKFRPAIIFEHDRKRLRKIGIDEGEFKELFARHGYVAFAPTAVSNVLSVQEYRFDGKGAKRDLLALPAS